MEHSKDPGAESHLDRGGQRCSGSALIISLLRHTELRGETSPRHLTGRGCMVSAPLVFQLLEGFLVRLLVQPGAEGISGRPVLVARCRSSYRRGSSHGYMRINALRATQERPHAAAWVLTSTVMRSSHKTEAVCQATPYHTCTHAVASLHDERRGEGKYIIVMITKLA